MLKRTLTAVAMTAAVLTFNVQATATADPDVLTPEDQTFMRLLDSNGLLFNFKLERYQGQRYCRDVMDGRSSVEAKEILMRNGAYSWDVANAIGSAAGVAYCRCATYIDAMGSPPSGQCSQWETDYARTGEY